MATMRELENSLSKILADIKKGINPVTGVVDPVKMQAQSQVMKTWGFDFEKECNLKENQKKSRQPAIAAAKIPIAEKAFFIVEILVSLSLEAGMAPAVSRMLQKGWDQLEAGEVTSEMKSQIIEEMNSLMTMFTNFRRTVLEE
jgi:hypothetical protein